MGSGRKTILTKELEEKIASAVEDVYYVGTACEYVGVSKHTGYRWMDTARDHLKQFHPEQEECNELCDEFIVAQRRFSDRIKRAQAKYEVDNQKQIKKHGDKNFFAAAWRLERPMPDKYGLRTRQDISVSGTVKHQHSISIEQRQKVLKAAADSLIIDTEKEDSVIEAEILSQDE
jgi:hypothetical protein